MLSSRSFAKTERNDGQISYLTLQIMSNSSTFSLFSKNSWKISMISSTLNISSSSGVETRRVDNRHRERDRKSFTLVDVEDLDAVRPSGIFFLDQLKTEFLLYQLCGNYTATFSKIRSVWRVFFRAPTANLDSRFSDTLDHLLLTKSDALASEKPPDSS
jgi:hypothetical protein